MQVILLQRIANLGKLGDTVNVKAGYGRNFLVPQGKALPATAFYQQLLLTSKNLKHAVQNLKK